MDKIEAHKRQQKVLVRQSIIIIFRMLNIIERYYIQILLHKIEILRTEGVILPCLTTSLCTLAFFSTLTLGILVYSMFLPFSQQQHGSIQHGRQDCLVFVYSVDSRLVLMKAPFSQANDIKQHKHVIIIAIFK